MPLYRSTSESFTVLPVKSSTASNAQVNASDAKVTLLVANDNRKGAIFYNNSPKTLYLLLGSNASLTAYTVPLLSGWVYELNLDGVIYTGVITGIWDTGATGSVQVTELT